MKVLFSEVGTYRKQQIQEVPYRHVGDGQYVSAYRVVDTDIQVTVCRYFLTLDEAMDYVGMI